MSRFMLQIMLGLALVSAGGIFHFPFSGRHGMPLEIKDGGEAGKSKKLVNYLLLSGFVKEMDQKEKTVSRLLDSARVELLDDSSRVIESVLFTIAKKKVTFKLPLKGVFTVRVSKEDHVTKFFLVNTEVPKEKQKVFTFEFEVAIFKKIEGLDVSVLDKPVAQITYVKKTNKFDYDHDYTESINRDLKELYKNMYYLSKD